MTKQKRPYRESDLHNYDMDHYGFHVDRYTDLKWDFPVAPHFHYCIEVFFVTAGAVECCIDGQSRIFCKGDLGFIGPNSVHSMSRVKNINLEYYVIKFDQDLLLGHLESVFGFEYITPLWESIKSIPLFWNRETIGDGQAENDFSEIYTESISGTYGFEYSIRIRICDLVLSLIRKNYLNNNQGSLGSHDKRDARLFLTKLNAYITSHFYEGFSAEQVAKYCNMSYSYFAKYFKACTSITFSEYVNQYRISKAESMMMTGQHNITDLAMESGYSSASYFIKQFKRIKGVSPKQYIKQALIEDH